MSNDANRNRPWSADDDATMAAMRAEGRTAREIAATLGRTRVAVRRRSETLRSRSAPEPALQQPAPTPPPEHDGRVDSLGRREWTPEDDARLADLRGQGLADADIGSAIGRTAGAVQVRISKLRLRGAMDVRSRKRRSPWTPERAARARSMRADGMTVSQVAVRVGCSAGAVGRLLRSPEVTEDSPGEGVRVRRTVLDIDRTGHEVEQARAALARAEARHREAMESLAEPVRAAIKAVGLVQHPEIAGDGEEDETAWALLAQLRRRGIELRRVA